MAKGFKDNKGRFRPTGVRKNPKFKRIARFGTKEFEEEQKRSQELSKKSQEKFREEKLRKIRQAKEARFQSRPRDEHGNVLGLGELTDKFIMEGDSEDDAFQEAKNVLGIR